MKEVHTAPSEIQEPSGKFLPAFFVDVVQLGEEFPSGELPLHMTYFAPLKTALRREYVEEARRYVNPLPEFTAHIGEPELFGDARDIPVMLVEPTKEVVQVHRMLSAAFGRLPHDRRFMPFRPHVTVHGEDARLVEGGEIHIGGLSLVEKDPRLDVWRVMAKIGLKGEVKL